MLKPLGFEFIPHIAHLFIEQEFNALWLKISFSTSTKGGFTCRNESVEKKNQLANQEMHSGSSIKETYLHIVYFFLGL